jgi:hypothetical protein
LANNNIHLEEHFRKNPLNKNKNPAINIRNLASEEEIKVAESAWVAKLLEKRHETIESTNSEAEGTPHYYEVLAQRGNLSEDLAAAERGNAMQRAQYCENGRFSSQEMDHVP